MDELDRQLKDVENAVGKLQRRQTSVIWRFMHRPWRDMAWDINVTRQQSYDTIYYTVAGQHFRDPIYVAGDRKSKLWEAVDSFRKKRTDALIEYDHMVRLDPKQAASMYPPPEK